MDNEFDLKLYNLQFTKRALQDYKIVEQSKCNNKAEELLEIIETNPFQNPPHYEK